MEFIKEVHFSSNLKNEIKHLTTQNKIVVVRNIENQSIDLNDYIAVANELGMFIYADENYQTGEFIPNVWTKVKYIKEHSSNTYKHSNLAQPIHTDYCYVPLLDMVLLICEEQAEIGGATTFINGDDLYSILKKYDANLLMLLENNFVNFGKGDNPIMTSKVKIITKNKKNNSVEVNWSKFRVSENNSIEVLEMVKEFDLFISNYIEKMGVLTPIMLQKGDAVFIQDNLVLHGRNSFIGNRCLLKGAIVTENLEKAKEIFSKIF